MRLPRDLSGDDLAGLLRRCYGYQIIRQTGSHMRLRAVLRGRRHNVTIPSHRQLRVGTIHAVISDVAAHLERTLDEVRRELFDS